MKNALENVLGTLRLLEVQLSHSWAPDAEMQKVMLWETRKAILLAENSLSKPKGADK